MTQCQNDEHFHQFWFNPSLLPAADDVRLDLGEFPTNVASPPDTQQLSTGHNNHFKHLKE